MSSGSTVGRRRRRMLLKAFVVLATLTVAFSFTAGAVADATPEISSDKADYAPGETATLTGTNWDPGEAVALIIRGSDGVTYDDAALEADAAGVFEHEFTLPEVYVESFTAEATGSSGARATTTFTDSNVSLSPDVTNVSVESGMTTSVSITATKIAQGPASNPVINSLSIPSGNANDCFSNSGATLTSSWLSTSSLPITMNGTNGSTAAIVVQVAIPDGTAAGNYRTRLSVNVTSNSGSANQVQLCVTVTADTTAPTISCTVPSQTVWYASDVTVPCTASDSGTGLASSSDASFSLTTNVAAGIETSAAPTNTRSVCDKATPANCATAGPYTFKVDEKAPQLTGCDAADGNWHGTDVTLHCSYSDGGSGPATQQVALSTNVTSGSETANAAASANGAQACDDVGNCAASPGDITGNKVDKKAPSVTCGTADSVWHAADVSIGCTAADGGSGLASSGDAAFNLTTNVAAGTEDANASTGTRSVSDAVGNSAIAGPVTGNKVDKKAPQLTGCDAADGNWHGTDVTLHCSYSDGGSGPATQQVALSTNVTSGSETANAAASANGAQACDDVGNCAASPGDITGNKVDKKAPSVTCGTADSVWHAADVSIGCTAADGGSGLASSGDAAFNLTTNVAAGTEDANASTGTRSVSDAVGNSAIAGPVTGNKVDKKAPAIACQSPAPVFLLGQSPATVTGVATDGGSGPASQSLSAAADTSSVLGNPKSVTLSATDSVGNSASKACAYSVVFGFHGFFQPVDNGSVRNVVNSGRAIPVKFDLSGSQGLDIFAPGYPASTPVSCTGSSGADVLEETLTAGNSSLTYSEGQPYGQYHYVWKTEKGWANTCRRLDLMFVDGTTRSALFQFTR